MTREQLELFAYQANIILTSKPEQYETFGINENLIIFEVTNTSYYLDSERFLTKKDTLTYFTNLVWQSYNNNEI